MDFIERVAKTAVADWKERRIMLPSIVIAQAMKESGRGTSELATEALALFGIKKNGWTGKVYVKDAVEQRPDGTYYKVDDTEWRAYESWEESILDHNTYIATRKIGKQTEPNWKKVIGCDNYILAVQYLQDAQYPYATSKTYAESLINDYIEKYDLTKYDIEEKDDVVMSNSPLVNYKLISPNSTNPRKGKIKKITIHHMAGNLSVETCGNVFQNKSRKASSNYGVGTDGRVGLYVEEKNRAWTSSNADNDNQAVTIEVANDGGAPSWHVSDKALEKTIELCVDICKRNGIEKLNFTGNNSGNLTMHKYFAATACPGPYLESKFPHIASEVNKRLGNVEQSTKLHRVQVGAFQNRENAEKLLAELKEKGYSGFIV